MTTAPLSSLRSPDPVTKAPTIKLVDVTAPIDDLGAKLAAKRAAGDDKRELAAFRDLLDKMLMLDPTKRITPREALAHQFVVGAAQRSNGGIGAGGGK